MTTSRFADATAVTPSGADDGVYHGRITEGWEIAGHANGGYLLALAGRALVARSGRPDPVTATAHFLAPGPVGPVDVETDIVRDGGRFTTATAMMRTAERRLMAVLATLGDLSPTGAAELVDARPPVLPDPDDCVPVIPNDPFPPPFMDKVELRLHPEDAGFRTGSPSGYPRIRGWFRLPDGQPVDTIALLCAVDAFPPTAFNARLPMGWTPTVEITAHVRARPEPGWLRCAFTTRFVTGGFLEEDGEIWDTTGRLVAQSRQLALVPRAALAP
jgi:acyl-CoA thioesterase